MNLKFLTRKISNDQIVSRKAYLLFAPTSILAAAVTETTRDEAASFVFLLFVSTLSYLTFLTLLGIYHIGLLKPRITKSSSIASMATVGLIIGAIKSLTFPLLADLLSSSPVQSAPIANQFFSGAFIGALTVPTIAYLNSEITRLKNLRGKNLSALINSKVSQMRESGVNTFLTAQIKHRHDEELSGKLKEILDKTKNASPDGQVMEDVLTHMSDAMRLQLNQIQDEIKANSEQSYPEITLRNLLSLALLIKPFPVRLITPILFLNAIGFVVNSSTSDQLLVRLLVIALVPLVVLNLGNLIIVRQHRFKWLTWLTVITSTVLLTFSINARIYGDNLQESIGPILIYEIWVLALSLLASLFYAFSFERNRIDVALAADLDESLVKQRALRQINLRHLSDLSEFIHGRVQSRLMTSAINLTRASAESDVQRIDEEFENLRSLAHSPLQTFETPSRDDYTEAITQLTTTWNGLLAIEVSTETSELLTALNVPGLPKLLEETLLNSFRHGSATMIQIEAKLTDSRLTITITDDGIGPRNGIPGIGSSLYDAFTTSWRLSPGPNGIGSQLTLEIDIPQDSN
jgi:signal transduction histidine kinase